MNDAKPLIHSTEEPFTQKEAIAAWVALIEIIDGAGAPIGASTITKTDDGGFSFVMHLDASRARKLIQMRLSQMSLSQMSPSHAP